MSAVGIRLVRRLAFSPATAAAALIVGLAFSSGGWDPGATGLATVVLALVLATRIALTEEPFGGLGRRATIAIGALAALATLTGLSAVWSDAPGRAAIELDRVLLYLLALVVFAAPAGSPQRLESLLRGLALAAVVVCGAGLASRLAPDVWAAPEASFTGRLSYPIAYWNALGLLAAVGAVLCLHLTSSVREIRALRVAAAGALPLLAVALYFTFSRGAVAAGVVALVLYVALARPGALISGLVGTVAPSALAVVLAHHADLLARPGLTGSSVAAQGHQLALALAGCAAAALLIRWASLRLDGRVSVARPPARPLVAGGLVVVVMAVATGAVGTVADTARRQADRFLDDSQATLAAVDLRSRFTGGGSSARTEYWDVALEAFTRAPLGGQGAGTYETLWHRWRTSTKEVHDAHSLYLESLAELGLVGLVCLAVALAAIVAALAVGSRGRDGAARAALLSVTVGWVLQAGVDWLWEIPAVTAWVFVTGGAALAGASRGARLAQRFGPRRSIGRRLAAAAVAALAILPAAVAISEVRLRDAETALRAGDCAQATDAARSARTVMPLRAEPRALIAFCGVLSGHEPIALSSMDGSVARDSENWELGYGQAIVRAAAGSDPRPALASARSLNPLSPVVGSLPAAADTPQEWRAWARGSRPVLRDVTYGTLGSLSAPPRVGGNTRRDAAADRRPRLSRSDAVSVRAPKHARSAGLRGAGPRSTPIAASVAGRLHVPNSIGR